MVTHDQNFKNLIKDYPREAVQFFAPTEAEGITANTVVTPLSQEQLKERLGDRFFELDVPLKVEWPNGEREVLVFCIEENSRESLDNLRRHAIYCLHLAEIAQTTRIVPVAIYPFGKKPVVDHYELTGDHGTYLQFTALSMSLQTLDAMAHLQSDNKVEVLCLPLMRYNEQQKRTVIVECIKRFKQLESDPERFIKFSEFALDYSTLSAEETNRIREDAEKGDAGLEEFVSTLDIIKSEGRAEGQIKSILELRGSGVISVAQAREILTGLAAKGELSDYQLRHALAQLPDN